ncbi:MAG: GspH/FimT family pseudopilin [Bermanella sp.]
MKKANVKHQSGLSLIELMVSITIMAAIVSAAVPAMQSLMSRKGQERADKLFERSIKLARSAARSRGAGNTITVTPNGSGFDWSQGWQIASTDAANVVEIIYRTDALVGSPTFTSNTFSRDNPLRIQNTGQATRTGTFNLYYPSCLGTQQIQYTLLISSTLDKQAIICPVTQ